MGKTEEAAVKKYIEWEKARSVYEEHKKIVYKLGSDYQSVCKNTKSNKEGFKQLQRIIQDCWLHLEDLRKKMEAEAFQEKTPPEKRERLVNLTKAFADNARKRKAQAKKEAELMQKYTDMRKNVVLAETERMDVDIKIYHEENHHIRDSVHLAIQSYKEPLHQTFLRIMHSEGTCIACYSCCAYCCYSEPMYGVYEDLKTRIEMLVQRKFVY
ncbi:uncharacterized protein LOC106168559 [Lingula anatina]|uniref:Uncharacterized protein LOC106168559 n=1 Tax=Lingula anatina TaxID=7574 RepID=A0A1S3IL37_LINAN|nr:uncharacterized protein LOC106168559 [Lingula anatina]XP_013403137.1 uncharacterized protein LOC106168559 [Lingula anatina]XP_013403147.1 uncharacterized protein LOC106168559 [Lingula anatina]|eukprot:XP_013403128.1 uncharacterized protein LOC106168559 [Lingula anatina]